MSSYNQFTMFFGYCINEKFEEIDKIEQEPLNYDGAPDFSLNYSHNKVGYKIVRDNLGKEELYFGVMLYSFYEYDGNVGCTICYDSLEEMYLEKIDKKYFQLFKERVVGKPKIYLISEWL